MTFPFYEWLSDQKTRDDLIGDLARVPGMWNVDLKLYRRSLDEHKIWADIVIRIAEPGHITVFNDAWQEFLLAKKAAQADLDQSGLPK